ncbi:hypothetical protein [Neobacillus vireti]|uniref:hypothetical protein n=1 Tax=Neobacillus vireti TaxID=220686 RepID=UPI002FFEF992
MVDSSQLDIADRLTKFRIEFDIQHQRLISIYGWDSGEDIRLTGLSKVANSLDFARTGLYLGRARYYKRIPERSLLPDQKLEKDEKNKVKKSILNQFHHGIKRGLFLSLHMSIESTIRVIARALGLEKDSFYDTYKELLNNLNPTKKNEYMNLLDVIRNIRNSIHSNGVYGNATKNITYGRITYNFTSGNLVQLKWSYIDEFLLGILEMLVTIAEHPTVVTLSRSDMKDPSAST